MDHCGFGVRLLASGLPLRCGGRGLGEVSQYPHLSLLPEMCPGMAYAFVVSIALLG